MAVYYLGCENAYFCYIAEDFLNASVRWMDETLTNFISWKRAISMTIDEKMEQSAPTVCYLCGEKINREKKSF